MQRPAQPNQVLVRQIVPGLAQPVFRAVSLQPGQVLQQQPGPPLPQIVRPPGNIILYIEFEFSKEKCFLFKTISVGL